jgi:hypothetical protein
VPVNVIVRTSLARYTAGVLPWYIAVPKGRDIHQINRRGERGALAPAEICDNKVVTDASGLEKRRRDWSNSHMFLIGRSRANERRGVRVRKRRLGMMRVFWGTWGAR